MNKTKYPIMKISRHRMGTEGAGITTLVAFPGCPLHCRYCLNNFCHDENADWSYYSSQQLYDIVKIDDFFFRMTDGGIVFGGGEPILQSEFIVDFINIAPKEWAYRIETSLNCNSHHVERLIPYIDQWIIDIKDMNSVIYKRYTGLSNQQVYDNINLLSGRVDKNRILFRIPHIPDYNTENDVQNSIKYLKSRGETDVFEYRTPNN